MVVMVTAKAQVSMIGKTEAEIKEFSLTPDGLGVFERKSQTSNGTPYLVFTSKTDEGVKFYYSFKNDICDSYSIEQPVKNLLEYIAILNEDYDKVTQDKWISKNHVFGIELNYKTGENNFLIYFYKL